MFAQRARHVVALVSEVGDQPLAHAAAGTSLAVPDSFWAPTAGGDGVGRVGDGKPCERTTG